jgi:hypothetical protein
MFEQITEVTFKVLLVLYNRPKRIKRLPYMRILEQRSREGRVWRGLLIVVAVLSLTISLATRFVVPATSPIHTVKTASRSLTDPQRQHLNCDAVQWSTPVQTAAFADLVVFYSRLAPTEPQIATQFFEDSSYNRPPPSIAFPL